MGVRPWYWAWEVEHKSIICEERIARKRSRESKKLVQIRCSDVAHDLRPSWARPSPEWQLHALH